MSRSLRNLGSDRHFGFSYAKRYWKFGEIWNVPKRKSCDWRWICGQIEVRFNLNFFNFDLLFGYAISLYPVLFASKTSIPWFYFCAHLNTHIDILWALMYILLCVQLFNNISCLEIFLFFQSFGEEEFGEEKRRWRVV